MPKSIEELIEVKRDGGVHAAGEIEQIVEEYVAGRMPDYQMSAWLMAAFIRGLDHEETVRLTDAMARSGRVMDLSSVPGLKVDKHSTGGVGDKTTICLAPMVAACGAPVAKMSGRGLGHTGGTLDKLESIPGFSVTMEPDAFVAQVRAIGIAVIAQTPDIDPADKLMYALRDVTATVPSVPLIVASIISKKVAGGADAIVLDVKVGSGAFMKTMEDARVLARELERTGAALGKRVVTVLTDMDQPLGMAVGNALEIEESIATLRGQGPEDLFQECLALGSRMLHLAGVARDLDDGRARLVSAVESGAALRKFDEWVAAQGGDAAVSIDLGRLPRAACTRVLTSDGGGWVAGFDAEGVGRAAMVMGAGRATKDDVIDPAAGLVLAAKVGDRVEPGGALVTLHAADERLLDAGEERFRAAVLMSETAVGTRDLVREQ
ncbi:MAG: thymidine phosphorylase [Coriobacteriia bacterium]|nr:thymidine phosphorylase [Coriobacteriia bacterium]